MNFRDMAQEQVICPRCGARPGEVCRTTSGAVAPFPHAGRWEPLAEAYSQGYQDMQKVMDSQRREIISRGARLHIAEAHYRALRERVRVLSEQGGEDLAESLQALLSEFPACGHDEHKRANGRVLGRINAPGYLGFWSTCAHPEAVSS